MSRDLDAACWKGLEIELAKQRWQETDVIQGGAEIGKDSLDVLNGRLQLVKEVLDPILAIGVHDDGSFQRTCGR